MQSDNIKNRSFLGALAAAIKALCMTLVDLFSVAGEGIAMMDKAVKTARDRQGIELGISMSEYANIAVAKASVEQAKAKEVLNEYIAADSTGTRKALIEEAHKRLSDIVDRELAAIEADRASRKQF